MLVPLMFPNGFLELELICLSVYYGDEDHDKRGRDTDVCGLADDSL